MQISLLNEIQIDQEPELIHQTFEADYHVKNGCHFLVFTNDEKEKVVLKFDQKELQMTRFSQPKSVMRFAQGQSFICLVPTPLGLQHLQTVTAFYDLQLESQALTLHYQLKMAEGSQPLADYRMTVSWG